MSEAVAYPVRVTDADLPPLSIDALADRAALHELTPRQYVAWRTLLHHLHKYGQLPQGVKALAAICKTGARSFEAMMPVLALHMDRDADGRWTHWDAMRSRGDRPVTPAFEIGGTELSQVRAQNGRLGAQARWGRKPRLELVGSSAEVPSEPAGSESMANASDADGKRHGKTGDDDMANGLAPATVGASPFASGAAPGPHGSFVRSSSPHGEDSNERTDSAGAGGGQSDGKVPGATDGKPDGKRAPDRSLAEVDTAALIATLRGAAPKVPATLLNPAALAPLVALIAEGCELERDVAPAVAQFTATLKEPLRGFGARPIRDMALGSRDVAAVAARTMPEHGRQLFVVEGTPAWRAWMLAKGVRSHFTFERRIDGRIRKGACFASEWPPGWDAERLAAVEPVPAAVP